MFPNIEFIILPAWDCMPYDNMSPSGSIIGERIKNFLRFIENGIKIRLIIITINAIIQKNIPINYLKNYIINLTEGQSINLKHFIKTLTKLGYNRASSVMEIGEYASRGGIIDIFVPSYDKPIRIDLFGDNIESIKYFDIHTQISTNSIKEARIIPSSEIILDEISINNFKYNYKKLFGIEAVKDDLYLAVSNNYKISGTEQWISLFYEKLFSLFDIIDNNYYFLLDPFFNEYSQMRIDDIEDYYKSRKISYLSDKKYKTTLNTYKPIEAKNLYLDKNELDKALESKTLIYFSKLRLHKDSQNLNSKPIQSFRINKNFVKNKDFITLFINFINSNIANKNKIIIACRSNISKKKILDILNDHNIYNTHSSTNLSDDISNIKEVSLIILDIHSGFIIDNLIVVSEYDLFGKIYSRPITKNKKLSIALEEADSFNIGDYLVHKDYGVGKYNGLKLLKINKVEQDFIQLSYLGDDKLYVPIQNVDLITKFSGKYAEVTLDKLGSKQWITKKNKVKEKLRDVAEELINVATKRKLGKAKKLSCNDDSYNNFVSNFPYYETQDQLNAIEDVIKDINSENSMDRLICGDVGFGKTEIALRSAFICVKSNMQVALIAPTTLLARQHYETFSARFRNEDIHISQLSRLTKRKEQKKIFSDINSGKLNIIIGTHALLSDKIIFKNLGLFIIDEEQRFGVSQKEKIKAMTLNVHVLTLTATPIPRTLHMSLSGIRDLSIIASAPNERIPVRTFITPINDFNIKEGIYREIKRGGQIFCIVPKIKDIEEYKNKIQSLLKEITIEVIHGKMKPDDIENIMTKFYNGDTKILLSTTIIENGLDIPNANTIFIFKAEMFGLAQLYQLKGRVGRSNKRAYAYYFLQNRALSINAEKRLHVIQSLDGLGAGFNIAAHDLDIRGAGNLLGEEQSGQIKEIGLGLYQKLLEEAVEDFNSHKSIKKDFSPQINIKVPALIPQSYVSDLSLRLQLYRRLGNLKLNYEFEDFINELIDRFGNIPIEIEYLIKVMKIKRNSLKIGISRIDSGISGATIEFIDNAYLDPEKFISWLRENNTYLNMRNQKKLYIKIKWNSIEERLTKLENISVELTNLIT